VAGALHSLPGVPEVANVFNRARTTDCRLGDTCFVDPSHAGVGIASIDFTGAPDAYFSNMFGVSG
jgi:hypothetical protein